MPLAVHDGIWAACGLAGGVAFGFGLGGERTKVAVAGMGGLIGAALGGALYELIGAMVFPGDQTTNPLSVTWRTRLLARLLVATLGAVAAATVVSAARRSPGITLRRP